MVYVIQSTSVKQSGHTAHSNLVRPELVRPGDDDEHISECILNHHFLSSCYQCTTMPNHAQLRCTTRKSSKVPAEKKRKVTDLWRDCIQEHVHSPQYYWWRRRTRGINLPNTDYAFEVLRKEVIFHLVAFWGKLKTEDNGHPYFRKEWAFSVVSIARQGTHHSSYRVLDSTQLWYQIHLI